MLFGCGRNYSNSSCSPNPWFGGRGWLLFCMELKTNPYGGVFAAVGLPNPWFGRVCVVYTCYKPLVC